MSYQPKVYKTDGGDTMKIASGGAVDVEAGGKILAAGTQAAHIADAVTNYTTAGLDTEAELITAINATNTKLNAILVALEGAGILASA